MKSNNRLTELSGLDINKDTRTNDDEPAVRAQADLQRLQLYHPDSPRGKTYPIHSSALCSRQTRDPFRDKEPIS